MGHDEASVLVTDIQQINERTEKTEERVGEILTLLRGGVDDQRSGILGRLSSLEWKMKLLIGGLVIAGAAIINNSMQGWRVANVVTAQPSSLANVFNVAPDDAVPRIGIDRRLYVEEIQRRKTELSAMQKIAKDSVAAMGPIHVEGGTWPRPTPSYTMPPTHE